MTYLPMENDMPDSQVREQVQELAVTVSSKGQVVIPADVRRRLGLVQGSVLRFVMDSEGVHLRTAPGPVQRLKGRLGPPPQPVTLADMDAAIGARRHRIGLGHGTSDGLGSEDRDADEKGKAP